MFEGDIDVPGGWEAFENYRAQNVVQNARKWIKTPADAYSELQTLFYDVCALTRYTDTFRRVLRVDLEEFESFDVYKDLDDRQSEFRIFVSKRGAEFAPSVLGRLRDALHAAEFRRET